MTDVLSHWLLTLAVRMAQWKERRGSVPDLCAWIHTYCPRQDGILAAEPYVWIGLALRRYEAYLPQVEFYVARRLNEDLAAAHREERPWVVYNMLQLTRMLPLWTFLGYAAERLKSRSESGLHRRYGNISLEHTAEDAVRCFKAQEP